MGSKVEDRNFAKSKGKDDNMENFTESWRVSLTLGMLALWLHCGDFESELWNQAGYKSTSRLCGGQVTFPL